MTKRTNREKGPNVSRGVDYARFARMLLGKGALNGRRIISEEAAMMIMSPRLPPEILKGG